MRINTLPADEVLSILGSSSQGLTEEEARRRLSEFGYNEIEEIRRESLLKKFFEQFTHFLALLLWIASLLCFIYECLYPGEGMLNLGIAIVSVIFVNGVFTFIQEYRAEKVLRIMKGLLPFRAKVLRNGILRDIDAREIVIGDIVCLNEGDRIPADMRLIESASLRVSQATLTGESEPIIKTPELCESELLTSPNILFAGTSVISGHGRAVVFATGMRTEFGKIAHLAGTVSPGISPLQREIKRITRIVGIIATLMGIVFFITGFLVKRTFFENFLFAIGIIVANVPEGLLPTVTLSLAMGSQRMAKRKALIKTLTSVETLGSVDVICTDKTGTLTMNRMEVKEVLNLNEGNTAPYPSLYDIALLCNNAEIINDELKGEPTEIALFRWASKKGNPSKIRIKEIPFDSERKRMSTVNKIQEKIFLLTKGAPESLLTISTHCLIGGEIKELTPAERGKLIAIYNSMMDRGLRVLAFGFRELNEDELIESDIEKKLVLVGLIGLQDPPRPEVPEAIRKCRAAGIKVIMITGDSSRTALSIARQIGLVRNTPKIIEGREFHSLTDRDLREAMKSEEIIFSRMTPKNKLRIVNILKEEGHRVAVTGDGVNDAPALRKADIGVAMGSGTDVAKEAADMILLDDNFATIVNAIEEGRAVFENIRNFITYIFASNIPEIVPYIAYVLLGIPLPLTIMQILAVDLGTDLFPALALGAEKPSKNLMQKPPRPPEERLLNWKVLSRAYLFLGPIEAIAGLYGYFYVLKSGGWLWGTVLSSKDILYLKATTACLGGIIITQIANAFACRSSAESVFRLGIFSNRLLIFAIFIEIIIALLIIYTGTGNTFFGTAPLEPEVWLVLLPFSIILFFAEELIKSLFTFLPGRR
ncbi:MAG: cation-transporting P-type ATPase [Thermodesulfovibrionales bacterium]|nr:cation-transporting P-type ATPase [Thermodesulfovibrionales bacterium]